MNSDRDFSFRIGRVFRKLVHVQGQSYKLLYVFILQQQDSIADSNLPWKKAFGSERKEHIKWNWVEGRVAKREKYGN